MTFDYYEWVELQLGEEVICRVALQCDVDTPAAEKRARARKKLACLLVEQPDELRTDVEAGQ